MKLTLWTEKFSPGKYDLAINLIRHYLNPSCYKVVVIRSENNFVKTTTHRRTNKMVAKSIGNTYKKYSNHLV